MAPEEALSIPGTLTAAKPASTCREQPLTSPSVSPATVPPAYRRQGVDPSRRLTSRAQDVNQEFQFCPRGDPRVGHPIQTPGNSAGFSTKLKPGPEGEQKGEEWKQEGDGKAAVLSQRGVTEVQWETREGLGLF